MPELKINNFVGLILQMTLSFPPANASGSMCSGLYMEKLARILENLSLRLCNLGNASHLFLPIEVMIFTAKMKQIFSSGFKQFLTSFRPFTKTLQCVIILITTKEEHFGKWCCWKWHSTTEIQSKNTNVTMLVLSLVLRRVLIRRKHKKV